MRGSSHRARRLRGRRRRGVHAAARFFDHRNAQRPPDQGTPRRTSAKHPNSPPKKNWRLLRDEQLSNIPALDYSAAAVGTRLRPAEDPGASAECDMRAGNFLGISALAGVVAGLRRLCGLSNRMEVGWVALLVGFILPYSYASIRRSKRFEKFEELFPEAIDTLARAVRAGHAFTTALEMITNEVAEPIAGEFRQLYEEQKFGMPVRDALFNLTERVPLVDVKFFVTAVMLQRETGGNLAEILDNLSYVIRERFKIQRQVRVYTAQGRLDDGFADGHAADHRYGHADAEPELHPSAIRGPDRPHVAGRWNYVADDWIFRDSQDYPDSGLGRSG